MTATSTPEPVAELVARLMERAAFARAEKTATALGDALHFEQAASTIATLTAERDAATARERARIVAKIRDIATRFEPGSASQNNHQALARAIESGHAFAEGNPK